jgi:hypothetical protein
MLFCVAALLSAVAYLLLPLALFADFLSFTDNPVERAIGLLLLPVVWLALVVMTILFQDSGPHRHPKGELELLIQLKHRGTLLDRSQRIRESAARTCRYTAIAGQSRKIRLGQDAPASSEDVMDHLVQMKRRKAWNPSNPGPAE